MHPGQSFLGALMTAILAPSLSIAQGVFVSIPPQAFVVDRLVGNSLHVEILLPPGASPATYEPTPKQMAALDRSRVYFQIGVPFEGPVLEKIADLMPDLRVVDCRVGVQMVPIDGHNHGSGDGFPDPHIWLDPQRMKTIARTMATALQELLPQQGSEIEGRLEALQAAIDATDRRVARMLAPHSGRTFVVFHPAFGYFARRYGLVQMALEEDGKSPSARQLAAVVSELSGQRVRALFVQPQFSRSAAERVATALECGVVVIDPLARDYLTNLESMAESIAEELK